MSCITAIQVKRKVKVVHNPPSLHDGQNFNSYNDYYYTMYMQYMSISGEKELVKTAGGS